MLQTQLKLNSRGNRGHVTILLLDLINLKTQVNSQLQFQHVRLYNSLELWYSYGQEIDQAFSPIEFVSSRGP